MTQEITGSGPAKAEDGSPALLPNWASRWVPLSWISRHPILARILESLLRPHIVLLLIVAAVVSHGITLGELSFYTADETRHAMNGVFFRDLLVDLPLKHPVLYAYEYYAKYPAVALPHWPPFFPFVEGIFFLVFGISVWVSRLTVLSFALLGVYFWYRIAERQGPAYWAWLSAIIFACMPYVLLFERVTMLEIPVISLCLGAMYFWLRWLKTQRPIHLWTLASFTAAALLTSQKAIFLLFFLGLHFLFQRRFRLLRRWEVWVALASTAAVVLPWYLLSQRTLAFASSRAIGTSFEYLTQMIHWTFYLTELPKQMGFILLFLSIVGIAWALFTAARRYSFLLIWVASCYVCFLLIPEKDPRHTMIWLPPLVYFALLAVEIPFVRRPQWGRLVSAGLALFVLFNALRFERPKVIGIEEVARYVLSLPGSDIVYYQGTLNGDFIFFVRKFDPEKRHMVAREKQVVVSQIAWNSKQVLHSPEEVLAFFRTWGIRYAVIESDNFLPGLDVVSRLVQSDQFEPIRSFRLWSTDTALANRQVWVYRYRGEIQRSTTPLIIPMMTLRGDIRVDLNRLAGRPWPN